MTGAETMKRKLIIISILLLGLILSGCQTAVTTTYYLGAKAEPKEVITLSAEEVEKQRWQDLYATVDYSYTHQGDQFDINGLFSFSNSAKINFTTVRRFKLHLFLLDQNMRVVDYREIVRALGYSVEDQETFNNKFELAENVVAFTFGYEGVLSDEGLSQTIFKLPRRNP